MDQPMCVLILIARARNVSNVLGHGTRGRTCAKRAGDRIHARRQYRGIALVRLRG